MAHINMPGRPSAGSQGAAWPQQRMSPKATVAWLAVADRGVKELLRDLPDYPTAEGRKTIASV